MCRVGEVIPGSRSKGSGRVKLGRRRNQYGAAGMILPDLLNASWNHLPEDDQGGSIYPSALILSPEDVNFYLFLAAHV